MLLENVWEFHFDPKTNIVETHISRLRAKVDRGQGAELIQTVRGSGYMPACACLGSCAPRASGRCHLHLPVRRIGSGASAPSCSGRRARRWSNR